MKLIGLAGRAGAGKDTVADYLVARHGFVKRGFADALYEEVAQAFGVTVEWLRDRSRKEVPQPELRLSVCSPPDFADINLSLWMRSDDSDEPRSFHDFLSAPRSPRWILQRWGTEYRRRQDPEYWVRKVHDFCLVNVDRSIAVPDTRFENEAEMIRELGGSVWHVKRENAEPVLAHESEKGVAFEWGIDRNIINCSTIDDLHTVVDFLLQQKEAAHVGSD